MRQRLFLPLFCLASTLLAAADYSAFDQPPHNYWTRPLADPFTRLKADLETGRRALDTSGERAFLLSLLAALDVPASSQMLVFSTTSLQLRLISPSNPRALFFNENVSVGYIPGGRIEIVSIDPEVGGIYYIFDVPRTGQPLRIERSDRCMNCHAKEDTGMVPGMVMKSVMPGPRGGSLVAYRMGQTGHGIALSERFGGWYVTGKHGITEHLGNRTGRLSAGQLTTFAMQPGELFNAAQYPIATSDVLPQLLLEHQVGFVNRAVEAGYRVRTALFAGNGQLGPGPAAELDEQARTLTRYMLFADEVPLPGVEGEAQFKTDFARNRQGSRAGASLKDFDLSTRLFRNRCSYMIYSTAFTGLPAEMKQRVYRRIGEALRVEKPDAEYAFLPAAEKKAIHAILKSTVSDLPADW